MKIAHVYPSFVAPARDAQGTQRVLESLARAQHELGHDICLFISKDSVIDFGTIIDDITPDIDIVHYHASFPRHEGHPEDAFKWISTIQGGGDDSSSQWEMHRPYISKFVCVSKFVADLAGTSCYVYNCANESELKYRDQKDDYFLWIGGTDWGDQRGLTLVVRLAKKLGFKLKIAGSGQNQNIIHAIQRNCDNKIEYVGAVNGVQKAEIISGAKAIFMIGDVKDACSVTNIESLASGTPIIAKNVGSYPEIINKDVGFICETERDIVRAIMNVGSIKSENCRKLYETLFSPKIIAQKYIDIYNNVLLYGDVRGKVNG